jgi:hypothetical protein
VEGDEVAGDEPGTLMDQLVEGVLPVGHGPSGRWSSSPGW